MIIDILKITYDKFVR